MFGRDKHLPYFYYTAFGFSGNFLGGQKPYRENDCWLFFYFDERAIFIQLRAFH